MRQRDRAEFVEFFESTWAGTFRRAYALCGDYQLAEDSAQSAYTKAYRAWNQVKKADNRSAYVRRIVVNEVLGMWRRASWRSEHVTSVVDERPDSSHEDAVAETERVWAAVRSLPPRQRAIVVLRYYEDLSEHEIAGTLAIRPGTVKSQASAALATLRQVLRTSELELERENS